jgi:hypothetical protein
VGFWRKDPKGKDEKSQRVSKGLFKKIKTMSL